MARGQQKLQSQAKAAEKQSKLKKQQGHSATDQKKAAQKALVHVCVVCKVKHVISTFTHYHNHMFLNKLKLYAMHEIPERELKRICHLIASVVKHILLQRV